MGIYRTESPRRRKRSKFRLLFVPFLLACIAGVAAFGWIHFMPNREMESYSFQGVSKPVFYRGVQLEGQAIGEQEGLKLPFEIFASIIDPAIYYEESSGSVIITTENKVLRLQTDQLTAQLNNEPMTLRFPVEQVDGTLYIPLEPLKNLYGLTVREHPETGAVLLHKAGDIIQWGSVATDPNKPDKTRPLRSAPTIKATIYHEVPPGEQVMIWGEEEGWYVVQLADGYTGYMQKADVILGEAEWLEPPEPEKRYVPWKPTGGKINLTWQQVYNRNPDTSAIGEMPGVNVISPQWFHLDDAEGNLRHMADASFVRWANDRGYQVWALVTNSFDPDLTHEALSTFERRSNIIKQLVAYSAMYGIQGINIDFENVYLKDKELMVQFVREAVPLLHEQGLVVSIDVTVKGGSETYSLFMDRERIGKLVDYMIVMTYDEHWATSPVAGSVASLPWVEKGITRIMEEDGVPASKLILGVPFYTRIWTETKENGTTKVSSRAVGMKVVEDLIAEKGLVPVYDEKTGQHYVEYREDGKTIKIWIEDEVSMKNRIDLVMKYDLAGVASWSRGFEKPEIWSVIRDTLEQRLR